jgi:hypothetical protein
MSEFLKNVTVGLSIVAAAVEEARSAKRPGSFDRTPTRFWRSERTYTPANFAPRPY